MGSEEAFVTLATNDSYGLGALVLGHSLRNAGTSRSLAILVTPGVTQTMRNLLSKVYNVVQLVDVLDSQDAANLALLARPELGITLTKLHAWNLTQFKKAVFLDADTLVLQNVDELFEREELSAVSDVGWPDCFNTGVFVFRPSAQTYAALIEFAVKNGSFDGGDQGLLNSFFHDWATKDIKTHLPFIYNMVATVIYSYAPAFKQFGQNVKIVHFLGSTKPWHQARPSGAASSSSAVLGEFLQLWWRIFDSNVRGSLEPGLAGLAGTFAQLNLGSSVNQFGEDIRKASHRHDWESGNIDYLGADSFDNIQRRIQESIGGGSATASAKSATGKEQSPPRVAQQASAHVAQSTQPQQHSSSQQHAHTAGSQQHQAHAVGSQQQHPQAHSAGSPQHQQQAQQQHPQAHAAVSQQQAHPVGSQQHQQQAHQQQHPQAQQHQQQAPQHQQQAPQHQQQAQQQHPQAHAAVSQQQAHPVGSQQHQQQAHQQQHPQAQQHQQQAQQQHPQAHPVGSQQQQQQQQQQQTHPAGSQQQQHSQAHAAGSQQHQQQTHPAGPQQQAQQHQQAHPVGSQQQHQQAQQQAHPAGSQPHQQGKQATPPPQSAKQASPAPQGVAGQPKQAATSAPQATKQPSPPLATSAQSEQVKPPAPQAKQPSPPLPTGQSKTPQGGQPPRPAQH